MKCIKYREHIVYGEVVSPTEKKHSLAYQMLSRFRCLLKDYPVLQSTLKHRRLIDSYESHIVDQ